MVAALAGISFSIAIIDNACNVLTFLNRVIKDTKAFGSDVRSLRTQIVSETARLQAFSAFLKNKTSSGETQFDQLSVLTKRAILGNVQELEILFGQYTALVANYKEKELQRGYELNLGQDPNSDIFGDELVEKGTMESKKMQKDASMVGVLAWGLFRKKKVVELAEKLTLWNDRLMKLLLCGLCFGNYLTVADAADNLTELQVSTGLTLRKLILGNTSDNTDVLKDDLTLLEPDSVSGIQRVAAPVLDGRNGIREDLVYVEYKTYELPVRRPDSKLTVDRACKLARLLRHPNASESGFQTLHLRCLLQQKRPSTRFAFVFDLPTGVDPKPITLLQAMEHENTNDLVSRPTLGQRFRIARSLAETLFQFHSVGWLHKSIRSENILLFSSDQQIEYSRPYLVGFEFSRDVLDRSNTEQDGLLRRNIYRHPDRQGLPSDEKDIDRPFNLLYDIYALGVVLLEVGLWRSAMGYENWDPRMPADEIQQSLEEHARQRLPHYMGQAYTDMVVACLQGAFVGEGRTGAALSDVERERTLLAYHEAVVSGVENGLSLK